MKVKVTYLKDFPDDMHAEDIEEQLMLDGQSYNMKIIGWEEYPKKRMPSYWKGAK